MIGRQKSTTAERSEVNAVGKVQAEGNCFTPLPLASGIDVALRNRELTVVTSESGVGFHSF